MRQVAIISETGTLRQGKNASWPGNIKELLFVSQGGYQYLERRG
jgi:hypothetical protein